MSLVGLDLGTSGCKAALLSEDGICLATAVEDYAIRTLGEGQCELNPDAVIAAALGCIRSVASCARADPPRAIAVAAAGEAVVPIDRQGKPLDAIFLSADRRGSSECHDMLSRNGEEFFIQETRTKPLPHYSIYKVMWWRKHRLQTYIDSACFVTLAGLVAAKLGAPPVVDSSLAARIGAFAPLAGDWSDAVLAASEIDRSKLPAVARPGTVIGEVRPAAAGSVGLGRHVRVVLGGFDQACAAFGVGILSAGNTALLGLGTNAAVVAIKSERNALSLDAPVTPHVVPGLVTAIGGAQSGAFTLRWYRTQLSRAAGTHNSQNESEEITAMIRDAAAKPTSVLCLPHFAGSRFAFSDPASTAAFTGITFATTCTDIVRALLDGVAYEIGAVIERLIHSGVRIDRLVAAGGGSKSSEWLQIIADAVELPVEPTNTRYATCIGAALLAGVGVGTFRDHAEAAKHAVRRNRVCEPLTMSRAYHRSRRAEFHALYDALCLK